MHLVSGGEAGMTQAVLLKHICLKGQTLLPLMLGKTNFSGLSGGILGQHVPKNQPIRASLVVQWLRLSPPSNAGHTGSVPGRGN